MHILGVDIDPALVERSIQLNCYKDNVMFRVADVMSDSDRQNVIESFLQEHQANHFNIVFCCSLTMWIHLNHGDDGLKEFLKYISSIADLLLLEPQPWSCYQAAARRMRKLKCTPFTHLLTLQWREGVVGDIMNYLESDHCSMKLIRNFGHTESWDRCLLLFESMKRN